jgi:hypothetical protein
MKKVLAIFLVILSLSFGLTLTACDRTSGKSLDEVTFVDASFNYDGKEHKIEVSNLPEGYTVEYIPSNVQKEAGEYRIIAKIKDGDGKVVKELAAMLIIAAPTPEESEEHTCDFSGEWKKDATHHWHECSCGEIDEKVAHSGGEATTTELAVCEVCGQEYGEFADEDTEDTTITEGYVVEVSGNTYQLSLNTSFVPVGGETAIAEYMYLGLNVTAGDKLIFKLDGVEITKVGPSSSESNVDEGMLVITTATDVAIYVKQYSDGGYSVWLEGKSSGTTGGEDQGGSDDTQIEGYVVEVSGNTYQLSLNTSFTPAGGDTAIAEYMALGLNVTAGDKIIFKLDGVEITKIGPSMGDTNVDEGMLVITTAEAVGIYIKQYSDGGYSVWLEGKASSSTGDVTSGDGLVSGKTLYLVPNGNWKVDGARFAAYFFGSSGDTWASMTDSDGDGIYECNVPDGSWTNVIFCRMNPSKTDNNWNNKWNQTADLAVSGSLNCYTVQEGTWDKGNGSWSTK